MTRYRISQETGISQASLSRFMHKKTSLSMESLDLIAKCIGMEVVLAQKKRGR